MHEPTAAMADLQATFAAANLPIPPVPAALAADLVLRDEWLWSTREIDRMEMYLFREYPREAVRARVPDHVAISHGGHGVNSYSINVHIVLGPLALFTQVGWGGVYMDNDKAIAEMTAQFEGIARVLAIAEPMAATWSDDRRLLVLESTFRGATACSWYTPQPDARTPYLEHHGEWPAVFDLAAPALEAGPG
ncbi:MAG: hypothetical protein WCK58_13500 [Chloroflexota bacterium]